MKRNAKIFLLIVVFLAVAYACACILYKFIAVRIKIDLAYALVEDLSSYHRANRKFPNSWGAFVDWTSAGNSSRRWNAQELSCEFLLNVNDENSTSEEKPVIVLDNSIRSFEDDINNQLVFRSRINYRSSSARNH